MWGRAIAIKQANQLRLWVGSKKEDSRDPAISIRMSCVANPLC